MKELYRNHKREDYVGIFVSLLTTAVIKFGDWLIGIMPAVGASIIETIVNFVYSLAATQNDSFLLRLIFSASIGILLGLSLNPIINGIKLYAKVQQFEKKSTTRSTEELEEIFTYSSKKGTHKKGDAEDPVTQIVQKGKKIGTAAISLIITFVILYLFVTLLVIVPVTLHDDFEQDLVKIAPYVEESEVLRLKSDWVCMRSKTEYDEIYRIINDIKEDYSLPR